MWWLLGSAHAHGHSHGASNGEDLIVWKDALLERTREIRQLFGFIQDHLDDLPNPFPLALVPNGGLLRDIAEQGHVDHGHKFQFLDRFFAFGPMANAVTAALHVMFATHILLRVCPPLGGSILDFLVAFAEGCILANVFFHLVPESLESGSAAGILIGFFFFCVLEKTLKIIGKLTGNVQTHSHSHSSSSSSHEKAAVDATAKSETKIYALLNVAADFTHNITDGVGLAAAFEQSTSAGTLMFVLMILHELPHQFGDFAVLMQGGASKHAALRAQLLASSGTVVGCVLYDSFKEIEWLEASITPFTAGVFLYIGAAGILPELMEVGPSPLRQAAVQLAGVLTGVLIMYATLN